MDKPKATPKDFFLWAGAMVSLYAGVVAFIGLLFDYINHVFRDPAVASYGYYYDPYQSGVAYAMASLIVLAPVFLILMRSIRRSIARDQSRSEVWVRRWALFLTLFIAGVTIVVDLIVLLNTFLSGEELTAAFLLKVLVVLLVAGAGFMHFLADIHGYWERNPAYARYINWAVGVLVVLTVLAGFLIIGSPRDQRILRVDQQRVSDLQNIQSQVVTYWQQKESLPATLTELNDPIAGFTVPTDPETGEAYGYTRQSPLDFTLCATFGAQDPYSNRSAARPTPVTAVPHDAKTGGDTWEHGAGEVCFDRSIDPERYPPYRTMR